uniref:LRAT domain-containing protein n=1 Tax=Electrophorus electricus TaxID=8005 RepID=A0AAY5E9B8_ELEEL
YAFNLSHVYHMPEKGDMVAFPRGPSGVVFKHYGIADGAGNVIHFAPDQVLCPWTYKKESIKDVATHDYYVDNSQDNKKNPLPPERILKDAEAKIGTQAHYDLSNFNCEIAASELRYGKGHGSSTQVCPGYKRICHASQLTSPCGVCLCFVLFVLPCAFVASLFPLVATNPPLFTNFLTCPLFTHPFGSV